MADSGTETLQVKGSKGLLVVCLSLLLGGGAGATAVGIGTGRDATVAPMPYLSRSEIEQVATARAERAEERANATAAAALARSEAATKEACDRQLKDEIAKLYRRLDRIDEIASDVAALKVLLPRKR